MPVSASSTQQGQHVSIWPSLSAALAYVSLPLLTCLTKCPWPGSCETFWQEHDKGDMSLPLVSHQVSVCPAVSDAVRPTQAMGQWLRGSARTPRWPYHLLMLNWFSHW